jgi:opacity protein-like surface antigen
MKKIILILMAAACAGSFAVAGPVASSGKGMIAPPPAPQKQGLYGTASGGAVWFQNDAVDFDTGWGVTGAVGYRWASGLQLELQSGYMNADMDTEDFSLNRRYVDLDFNGEVEQVPIVVNAIYRLFNNKPFSLYFGVGAGVIYTRADIDASLRVPSLGLRVDAGSTSEDWNFALQGIAGGSFAVTENIDINVGYRYIHTFNDDLAGDDLGAHMAEAGVTIRF